MHSHTHSGSRHIKPPKKIILRILNKFDDQHLEAMVYPWLTVAELKQKLQRELGIPVSQQRLFMRTQELTMNNMSLLSYGIHNKNKLILRAPPKLKNTIGLIKQDETFPADEAIHQLVFAIQEGFNIGLVPKPTIEGTSGSYLLRNPNRKPIAIFKPFDEEPFAPNNPKGYQGKLGSQGFRKGVLSGESAAREVAAYLIDSKGFFGIPPTTFVEIAHHCFANRDYIEPDIEAESKEMIPEGMTIKDPMIKHGSLQKFIQHNGEASDYGYGQFPDDEVRKIAIFDILMLNCDRNEGNILVKKDRNHIVLVPIDHGLCLPDCIDICSYEITWVDWPQIRKPFTEIELEYINTIKPKEDAIMLAKYLKFRDVCLRNYRIGATILIKCANAGMTISDIADILYKDDPDLTSPIQEIISRAELMTGTMRNSINKDFLDTLTNSISKNLRRAQKSKTLNNLSKQEFKLKSVLENDGELLKSLGGMNLRLGGKSQSDKPISIEEFLLKDDFLTSIPEEADTANDQQTTKDTTSEDPEEEDHEIYGLEHKSKPETKANLKRNASLPDLKKFAENNNVHDSKTQKQDQEESKENIPKTNLNEIKTKTNCMHHKGKNETPSYLDELFFYYFEELLSRKIESIMEKKNSKPKVRARFMSEGCQY